MWIHVSPVYAIKKRGTMRKRLCCCVLWLLCTAVRAPGERMESRCLAAPATPGFHVPTVTCPYGKGIAAAKRHRVQPLIRNDGKAVALQDANAQIWYDDEALYVAPWFHTAMNELNQDFKMPDGRLKRDAECIRIFLKPDLQSDVTFEVRVSARRKVESVRWRGGEADVSWDSQATARSIRWTATYYTNEIAIGFERVGPKPRAGAVWGFNVAREDPVTGENANWAGVGGDENLTSRLGLLRFADSEELLIAGSWILPKPILPGTNRVTYRIHPPDPAAQSQVLISEGGDAFVWASKLPTQRDLDPVHRWLPHVFNVPQGMPLRVQFVVRKYNGAVHYATAAIPVPMPRADECLARLSVTYDRLVTGAAAVRSVDARKAFVEVVAPIRDQVAALSREVASRLRQPSSRQRLSAIDDASKGIERLDHRSHLLAGSLAAIKQLEPQSRAPQFNVGHTHSLVKLRRFQADVDYGKPLRIELARRERESAQLVVVPFDTPLEGVSATWTDLTGAGGAKLGRGDIRMDVVDYVQTTAGGYASPWVGWWPDPLPPLEPTNVPIDQIQPLWVTVYAPPSTPAGTYRGTVTVMQPHKDWDSFVDIWIPTIYEYNHDEWRAHLRNNPNDQVWWYTTRQTPPFASVLLDVPAISHRALFWQHYKYRIPGYLYYGSTLWRRNLTGTGKPRFPDIPWVPHAFNWPANGSGVLFYPGKDGLLAGVRLAVIRDGVEDWEAFAVLEELTERLDQTPMNAKLIAANREMLEVPDEVTRDLRHFTKDPLVLLRHRRLLAQQIVKTRRVLGE